MLINKFPDSEFKFETGKSKKYEIEAIQDNTVYTKEVYEYLLGLYYLVA